VPFTARRTAARPLSPLKKGECAEAVRMAPENLCTERMSVMVRIANREFGVPIEQSDILGGDEDAHTALADWRYWLARVFAPSEPRVQITAGGEISTPPHSRVSRPQIGQVARAAHLRTARDPAPVADPRRSDNFLSGDPVG